MEASFDELERRFDDKLETVKKELKEDIAHIQSLPASLGRRVDHLEDDVRLVKTKAGIR